jgi:molecular chaperone GrpE
MKAKLKKDDVQSHKKRKVQDEKGEAKEASVVDQESDEAAEDVTSDAGVQAQDESTAKPQSDDRLLRLQADFDNFRKRMIREKADIYRRANEDIMEELLPVLDHLELALAAVGDANAHDSIAQGFKLVGEQLLTVLKKFGLTPIETEGTEFDPNVHEAVLHMPSVDVDENGIVSQTRAGYRLGGQLLRAAQVVVSSGAPNADDSEADAKDDA